MTNIPPNLVPALTALTDAINGQNKRNKKIDSEQRSLFGRMVSMVNTDIVGSIGGLAKRLSPLDNMVNALKNAEKINTKAVAAYSSQGKMSSIFAKSLKTNLGDPLLNLQEFTENFDSGIRINSNKLNDLTVRMRLTGQSTDKLRSFTTKQLIETGSNTEQLEHLITTTQKLSKQYAVSEERLIDSMKSIEGVTDIETLFDNSGAIKELQAAMTAKLGGSEEAAKQTNSVLSLILGATQEANVARMRLGINDYAQTIRDAATVEEKLSLVQEAVEKANNSIENNIKVQGGGQDRLITDLRLNTFAMKGSVIAISQMSKGFDNINKSISEQAAVGKDMTNMLANTQMEEKTRMYSEAVDQYYPMMTDNMPKIVETLSNAVILLTGIKTLLNAKDMAGNVTDMLGGNFKQLTRLGNIGSRRGLGNVLKGAPKLAGKVPVIGGLVSAGMEYSESGDLSRAAAVGAGTTAGGYGGFAAGAAIGTAIFPGIGTAIGGLLGGLAGAWFGEESAKAIHDQFDSPNKVKQENLLEQAEEAIKTGDKNLVNKLKEQIKATDNNNDTLKRLEDLIKVNNEEAKKTSENTKKPNKQKDENNDEISVNQKLIDIQFESMRQIALGISDRESQKNLLNLINDNLTAINLKTKYISSNIPSSSERE